MMNLLCKLINLTHFVITYSNLMQLYSLALILLLKLSEYSLNKLDLCEVTVVNKQLKGIKSKCFNLAKSLQMLKKNFI